MYATALVKTFQWFPVAFSVKTSFSPLLHHLVLHDLGAFISSTYFPWSLHAYLAFSLFPELAKLVPSVRASLLSCITGPYFSFIIQFGCYVSKEASLIPTMLCPSMTPPCFLLFLALSLPRKTSVCFFSPLSLIRHHEGIPWAERECVLFWLLEDRPPPNKMALGTKQVENEHIFHELSFINMQVLEHNSNPLSTFRNQKSIPKWNLSIKRMK